MSKKTEAWKVERVLRLVADGEERATIAERVGLTQKKVSYIVEMEKKGGSRVGLSGGCQG